MTTDGAGLSDEALRGRLQEISRQREELLHLEIKLRAQSITRSQIIEMHQSYRSQIKDHIDATTRLKHRVAQETILYKDEQLRVAQAWITRVQEVDALQSSTNQSLQAELGERTELFNQYWIALQRQTEDAAGVPVPSMLAMSAFFPSGQMAVLRPFFMHPQVVPQSVVHPQVVPQSVVHPQAVPQSVVSTATIISQSHLGLTQPTSALPPQELMSNQQSQCHPSESESHPIGSDSHHDYELSADEKILHSHHLNKHVNQVSSSVTDRLNQEIQVESRNSVFIRFQMIMASIIKFTKKCSMHHMQVLMSMLHSDWKQLSSRMSTSNFRKKFQPARRLPIGYGVLLPAKGSSNLERGR